MRIYPVSLLHGAYTLFSLPRLIKEIRVGIAAGRRGISDVSFKF